MIKDGHWQECQPCLYVWCVYLKNITIISNEQVYLTQHHGGKYRNVIGVESERQMRNESIFTSSLSSAYTLTHATDYISSSQIL